MGYGRVNANNAVWAVCDTTFFEQHVNISRTVTGCDIVLKNLVVIDNNSKLTVRARNSVTIKGKFCTTLGSSLEIIPYKPTE